MTQRRGVIGFCLLGGMLVAALGACSSESDPPGGGAGSGGDSQGVGGGGGGVQFPGGAGGGAQTQTELSDGTVGSSCSGECQGDLQCAMDAAIPNGFCTKVCASDAECGPEGRCVTSGSTQACFRSCTTDIDCRPGYSCKSAGGFSVCDVGAPATGGGDCSTVAVPAVLGNGCAIRLVTPTNCEEIDLSNGKSREFAWSTDTTMCETPFYLIIAGNPPSEQNAVQWELSDAGNDLVTNNIGGLHYVTAADLAGLTSDNGIYHWVVAGWYGSHPDSRTFRIRK